MISYLPIASIHNFTLRLQHFKSILLNLKKQHWIGKAWELFQIFLSVFASVVYIAESYSTNTYANFHFYFVLDAAMTQFFMLDFVINWLVSHSTSHFFSHFMTYIDILTIIPVYVNLAADVDHNLTPLRFIRTLRIVRAYRIFRFVGGISVVKKQLIALFFKLFCLTFVAAGIFCVLENDFNQLSYECRYIGASTVYKPSCSADFPAEPTCDCSTYHCEAAYAWSDSDGQPSRITCHTLHFLEAYYFVIVTISTVGYGDITPSTVASRAVMVLFIIASIIVIPEQINRVTSLLSATSIFRGAYVPRNMEEHVIFCGYLADRRKLERILREFFHPDRSLRCAQECHIVLLGTTEPNDDVKELILGSVFDTRVTYLIGSPISPIDLQRARLDIAASVFFLSNSEAPNEQILNDGNELVLNVLAVTDYNPNVSCLVQVLQSHDSDILKHSDVDVVLCLDEFKTVILGRNAVCHGLSTMIDNLFHTVGGLDASTEDAYWLKEYHDGAAIEVYYIPLPRRYLEEMKYDWNVIVEGVFLEFDCILLGITDTSKHSVYINACDSTGSNMLKRCKDNPYFAGILLTDSQVTASNVTKGLNDNSCIERIVTKLIEEECRFGIRQFPSSTSQFPKRQYRHLSRRFSGLRRDSSVFHSQEFKELMRFSHITSKLKQTYNNTKSIPMGSYSFDSVESARHNRPYDDDEIEYNDVEELEQAFSTTGLSTTALLSDDVGEDLKKFANSRFTSGYERRTSEIMDEMTVGYIKHALNMVDHIVVCGCLDYLPAFIEYTLTPTQQAYKSFPIVIVSQESYSNFSLLHKRHSNVFFLQGDISSKPFLSKANISNASSLVMLASRPSSSSSANETDRLMDFQSLFMYLRLCSCVPPKVFFVVELTCTENMSVLNSAAIRKENRAHLEARAATKSRRVVDAFYSLNLRMRRIIGKSQVHTTTEPLDRAMITHDFRRITHDPQQKIGIFTTQYVDKSNKLRDKHFAELLSKNAGRRLSSILMRQFDFDTKGDEPKLDIDFWDNVEGHIDLPIFASGRAFVPNLIDNLLCQSFFSRATTNLCEALVCGQKSQTMFLIPVPTTFVDSYFKDVFRAFVSRNVLILGVYRSPQMNENAVLPCVFTCPTMKSVLRANDRIYAYGNPEELKEAEALLWKPFKRRGDTSFVEHDVMALRQSK